MVLFLGEAEVQELLNMDDAVHILEETFRQQGKGNIINHPRNRIKTPKSMLHYLPGAVPHLNVMGYKAYTSSKAGIKFRVFLHDIETGELLSIMDGNYMGMIRTGAATSVATKHMSRQDSSRVGIYGAGWQARGQAMGVCAVREIKSISVYSRDPAKRKAFCVEMGSLLEIEVIPAEKPRDALNEVDIVITSTTSVQPVFSGEWLEAGVHINAIGGNFLFKREIDELCVSKSDVIVVESKEQSKIEAGEFMPLVEKGRLWWERIYELGEVVTGKVNGRNNNEEITLFKSLGIAIEDIAVAAHIYKLASVRSIGKRLDIPSI
jgi:ornithine cyclodeaminase/alanine dehydrogenase-like protein (mu-crystallin family)